MFNVIHGTGVTKIDFIVRKETEYRRLEFSRRRPVTILGKQIWLVSPEDLLLSKLYWARQGQSQLQLNDIKSLMMFVASDLDWAYVEQWSEHLDVGYLLAKVRP